MIIHAHLKQRKRKPFPSEHLTALIGFLFRRQSRTQVHQNGLKFHQSSENVKKVDSIVVYSTVFGRRSAKTAPIRWIACSCPKREMCSNRSFKVATVSVNSHNFTLLSFKTIRCTYSAISAFLGSFSLPDGGALELVWFILNSQNHLCCSLFVLCYSSTISLNVEEFIPSKNNVWSRCNILVFPFFFTKAKAATTKRRTLTHKRVTIGPLQINNVYFLMAPFT